MVENGNVIWFILTQYRKYQFSVEGNTGYFRTAVISGFLFLFLNGRDDFLSKDKTGVLPPLMWFNKILRHIQVPSSHPMPYTLIFQFSMVSSHLFLSFSVFHFIPFSVSAQWVFRSSHLATQVLDHFMASSLSPKEKKKSLLYKSGNGTDVGEARGAVTCHTSFSLFTLGTHP